MNVRELAASSLPGQGVTGAGRGQRAGARGVGGSHRFLEPFIGPQLLAPSPEPLLLSLVTVRLEGNRGVLMHTAGSALKVFLAECTVEKDPVGLARG